MAHAAPLAVAIALYFAHARFLMSGQLAANALRGWLLPYMPSSLGGRLARCPAMSGGDLGALLDYGSVVRTGWAVPGLQLFVTDLAEFERIVSEAAGT